MSAFLARAHGGLRRLTGTGLASAVAFALLAGGCVLAATLGPRQAQATAGRALAQALAAVPPADRTIVAATSWSQANNALQVATTTYNETVLAPADLDNVTSQLRGDFGRGQLGLGPATADWTGLTPALYPLETAPPGLHGLPATLEVADRSPLAGHLRLVAGRLPGTGPPPVTTSTQLVYHLQVVVTPQTASRFGLRPGSQLPLNGPVNPDEAGMLVQVQLDVTGIAEPADPGSSFWTADPLLPRPALDRTGGGATWEAAVIAGPGEVAVMQQLFGQEGLYLEWQLPTSPAAGPGGTAALYQQVNHVASQTPRLTGLLAPLANALTVSYGLAQPLAAFVAAASEVNVLLLVVYACLAVAGLVTLLLAGRMLAARRLAELTLRRARGASLWQLFALGAGGAAVAAVPAAALAWAAAAVLVPGAAPAGAAAWWPGLATLACATVAPGLAAAWPQRPPRRAAAGRRRRWLPRVMTEVTAAAAAAGGITVFRLQTGATDLYVSLAPVLVAVITVIVALRLYQLVLRGLARAAARRRGVTGFVGLSRAARAPAALALPAMTLVLALTVAAFTGMVRGAVLGAETAASWRATGADVVLSTPDGLDLGFGLAATRAVAAVPGVRQAATARVVPLTLAGGQVVTAVITDPASYAALTAATPGFSPVRPALLTAPGGPGAVPVLASRQAAAYLGGQPDSIVVAQQGLPTLRVRVAGDLGSTPAVPGGGAFIVLPQSALAGASAPPPVNLMLLDGPSIDPARLQAVVRAAFPGGGTPAVSTRAQALRELTAAPLQQGTFTLFSLAIGYAAALAAAVMLLGLALGAAERELITARLATMGLDEGQRVRLVALEVIPPLAAAAVAAAACAVALPRLVSPAIDLSVFTHSAAPVPLRPDFALFALALAALLVLALAALGLETRSRRGRGVAVTMRS